MLKCLREVSLQDTYIYRSLNNLVPFGGVEDIYFTHALEILEERGYPVKLPEKHVAGNFSVEALYSRLPLGIHGFDKDFLSLETTAQLFADADIHWQ